MSKPESEPPVSGPEPAAADLRKPADAAPAQPAPPVPTAAPEPSAPEPSASADASADPWAAPAGPPAPAAPWPAPQPAPAPPTRGGWAAVPPAAQSGFQPGFAYPQAAPATNGFAAASLVTGLVLVAPLALLFGIIGLVQINRRGERGFGMALTGLVLGGVGTALMSLAVVGLSVDGPDDRSGRPPKAPAGSVAWAALKSGDCYNTPENGSRRDPSGGDETLFWVRRVPCSAPHHGEVAGTAMIPSPHGPSYPGESRVREVAAELCRKVLDDYALDQWAVPDGMDDVYLYPTQGNWKSGERYVTCAFEDRGGDHLGTVRTDRSKLTPAQLAYLDAVRGFNDVYGKQPKKSVADAPSEYRDWARLMALASHAEATALGKDSTGWPAEVKPTVDRLAAAQRAAAGSWDAAAAGADLEGDVRRARALVTKTVPLSVEIRRGLGLSTGEQVPDLQV
ncbi:DUF4190 domain-containing protein [Kitasatospora sp. NPDC051705]|uniref:DUF4190 domain-containing protein n=1 Tax=Kitasatospora sp. NPDC051705 TaxID=3364057 RepID=UPI0037B3DC9F